MLEIFLYFNEKRIDNEQPDLPGIGDAFTKE